jgi:hypothetical protein
MLGEQEATSSVIASKHFSRSEFKVFFSSILYLRKACLLPFQADKQFPITTISTHVPLVLTLASME